MKTKINKSAYSDMINIIETIDSSKSKYDVLNDFIAMYALDLASITGFDSNDLYKSYAVQYNEEQLLKFCELGGLLIQKYEENPLTDILTEIYMKSGFGNKNIGQDFTPPSIAKLTSEINVDMSILDSKDYVVINEPSCGAGSMILNFAKKVYQNGYNPQTKLYFIAQDIDYKCVYMTYIQMSLNGLAGEVIVGNTLHNEIKIKLKTPMTLSDLWIDRLKMLKMGNLLNVKCNT